ncbi:MAG: DUF4886 domain-containing protein [Clostridia bacterium]|nr:DUF4886 domain-containing protein [Clostridia bacterium]
MKILSIGNSFSQDAHRWLYDVCKSADKEIYNANIYYGGCSLVSNWDFYVNDRAEYDYEIKGVPTRKITLREALTAEKWDIITYQQASHESGKYERYKPFLCDLHKVVKEACPSAKFYIHQTWAYEIDSTHPSFVHYNSDQHYMYDCLSDAYRKAAESINADIIPAGDVIQYLRDNISEFDYKNGGYSLNQDGFHLSHGYGRYAASLTWYCKLFSGNANDVSFVPKICDDEKLVRAIKAAVNKVLSE